MSSSPENREYPYGYGLSKISLAKIYMNKANVQKWTLVLSLVPFLVMYLWILFREHIFSNEAYEFLDSFIFALSFLVWGFLGLFWAYRKRVPQFVMVKGKPAYLMGMFTMIVSWAASIYLFLHGLYLLLNNLR